MRIAPVLPLVLGLVGACVTQPDSPGYSDPYPYPDPGGGGGGEGYGCTSDTDCSYYGSGYVCASDEECEPASDVQTVHITWTIMGQPAGSGTCASTPDLELLFNTDASLSDSNFQFGYAPVPCTEGEFTILHLPTYYAYAGLFDNSSFNSSGAPGVVGTFDGSGDCALDITF